MIEIRVPELGESIQEVQVSQWMKQVGEWVGKDEDLVELESEKAAQAIPCPEAGTLTDIQVKEGEFANVGDLLAKIAPSAAPESAASDKSAEESVAVVDTGNGESRSADGPVMPAAQRMLDQHGLHAADVPRSGPGGRLLKEDVARYIEENPASSDAGEPADVPPRAPSRPEPRSMVQATFNTVLQPAEARSEEVRPMSMIRRTIAARLVEAQQQAALLTTFNEIDMGPVSALRKKYKELFISKHGVKLGFMSFFAKASVEALRRFPAINASVLDNEVIYRNYQDIGIAIGGGKGLVVPVLRDVQRMSFADVEKSINEFAQRASENKLGPKDLEGGTFTISNGGVYGSLLSTPIVNPPQSGILGLHSIQDRPMAINGEVVIRPMMYVALTYDHRIVDGREAVGFLRCIKEVIEDPSRLFLEV